MLEHQTCKLVYVSPLVEKTGGDGRGLAGFTVLDMMGDVSNLIKEFNVENRDCVLKELEELRNQCVENNLNDH